MKQNKNNGVIVIDTPKDKFTKQENEIIGVLVENGVKIAVKKARVTYKPLSVAYPMSEFDLDGDKPEQFGDNHRSQENMYSDANANLSLIKVLKNLEDKHRMIFMFLLLRESGYNLTHEECANVFSISRQAYMKLVKTVKMKAGKLLQG